MSNGHHRPTIDEVQGTKFALKIFAHFQALSFQEMSTKEIPVIPYKKSSPC